MIRRIPMPDFLATYPWRSNGGLEDLVPAVHRALNEPKQALFPLMPDDLYQAISYWEAACYVMIGLLGWSNPGKGLLWWHERGRDDHGDPRLALLRELWDDQRQIDLLAAWFWSKANTRYWNVYHCWNFFEPMTAHADDGICPPVLFSPDSEWWAAFRARFTPEPTYPNPFFGGDNPLHLLHLSAPWEMPSKDDPNPTNLRNTSPKSMRARLYLTKPHGWISALSTKARWIGQLGWGVDVVIEGWGWLGTFRRSPVTGLWYQGSHHIHLAGNLHANAEANVERWSDADYFPTGDALPVGDSVREFIDKQGLKPAQFSDSPSFVFQIGEQRRSEEDMLRTICGFARSEASEPFYIVFMHENGKFAAKHAWKAHEEYGPVNGIGP